MAGNIFGTSSDDVTCSTSAKTILQIRAAANVGRLVRLITVTGKTASGGSETPAKVRLTRSGQTGTGSAVTEGAPVSGETLQGSSKHTFTVEPTSPAATGYQKSIHPAGAGVWVFDPPLRIPGGQALNVEVTGAAGTPVFNAEAECEE